jgi:hypothetical protein
LYESTAYFDRRSKRICVGQLRFGYIYGALRLVVENRRKRKPKFSDYLMEPLKGRPPTSCLHLGKGAGTDAQTMCELAQSEVSLLTQET